MLLIMVGAEWMKGICHMWSRGRHFSPSLPEDRYLKLSPQKRSPGRNLGEHRSVRRSGTTSRGTALLVFSLRMRCLQRTKVFTIFVGKRYTSKVKLLQDVNATNSCKSPYWPFKVYPEIGYFNNFDFLLPLRKAKRSKF